MHEACAAYHEDEIPKARDEGKLSGAGAHDQGYPGNDARAQGLKVSHGARGVKIRVLNGVLRPDPLGIEQGHDGGPVFSPFSMIMVTFRA